MPTPTSATSTSRASATAPTSAGFSPGTTVPRRRRHDMPIHKLRREDLGDYGNILVSEAVPLDDPVPAPFTAHWCVVEPGATSERHMHREIEAFFVTSGRGVIAVDGEESEVEAGDTISLDPLHDHTIHNPAENTDDLVFVTVYWA